MSLSHTIAEINEKYDFDNMCQYLIKNETGQGANSYKMLDTGKIEDLDSLKKNIANICKLPRQDFTVEIYDPVMKKHYTIDESLSGLTKCANLRIVNNSTSESNILLSKPI